MNVNYVIIKSAVFLSNITVRQTLETNLILNRADLLYGLCAVPNSLGTQFNHCKSPFSLQRLRLNEHQTRLFPTGTHGPGTGFTKAKLVVRLESLLGQQETASTQGQPGTCRDIQHLGVSWFLHSLWKSENRQTDRNSDLSAFLQRFINSRTTNTWLAYGYPKLPSLFGQIFNCCNWAHLWRILLSECENLGQMQQTLRNPSKLSDQSYLILEKNGHLKKTRPRSPELFHSCVQNRNKISSSWVPILSSLFTVLNNLKSSRITENQVGPKAHKELRINNRFYYSSWILR